RSRVGARLAPLRLRSLRERRADLGERVTVVFLRHKPDVAQARAAQDRAQIAVAELVEAEVREPGQAGDEPQAVEGRGEQKLERGVVAQELEVGELGALDDLQRAQPGRQRPELAELAAV